MAAIDQARSLLAQASRVVVLTGAGISTESGIPDFRGPDGVWTKNPGAEKLSSIDHYVSDPEVRRAAWRRRIDPGPRPQPNDGHRALVELERAGRLDTLITQNIDGLHRAAGTDPSVLVEVHGSARDFVCLSCGDRGPIEPVLDRVRAGEEDPDCERCGGMLKSAVVSFGQGLAVEDLARADAAARGCDLLLAIGTTLGVYPVANVVPIAKVSGAPVVILNAGPTEMDDLADVRLDARIGEVLPVLVASVVGG